MELNSYSSDDYSAEDRPHKDGSRSAAAPMFHIGRQALPPEGPVFKPEKIDSAPKPEPIIPLSESVFNAPAVRESPHPEAAPVELPMFAPRPAAESMFPAAAEASEDDDDDDEKDSKKSKDDDNSAPLTPTPADTESAAEQFAPLVAAEQAAEFVPDPTLPGQEAAALVSPVNSVAERLWAAPSQPVEAAPTTLPLTAEAVPLAEQQPEPVTAEVTERVADHTAATAHQSPQAPEARPAFGPPAAGQGENWGSDGTRLPDTNHRPYANYTERSGLDASSSEHYRDLKKDVTAAFLTGLAIDWYINHKVNKHEKSNQESFGELRQTTDELTQQQEALRQQQAQERQAQLAQQARQERFNQHQQVTLQEQLGQVPTNTIEQQPAATAVTPEEAALAAVMSAHQEVAPPQPRQHVEQDAWKRYVMVNGKVEQDAVEYGRAFHEEQRAEQVGSRFNPQANGGGAGGVQPDPLTMPASAASLLPNGQVPYNHALQTGAHADPQHLLKPPRNPVAEAATNPWVWVGLAVLLLAFFTAAFA